MLVPLRRTLRDLRLDGTYLDTGDDGTKFSNTPLGNVVTFVAEVTSCTVGGCLECLRLEGFHADGSFGRGEVDLALSMFRCGEFCAADALSFDQMALRIRRGQGGGE